MQTGIETEQLVEHIALLRALPDRVYYQVRDYDGRADFQIQADTLDQVQVIQGIFGTSKTAWWSGMSGALQRVMGIVSGRLSVRIYAIPTDVHLGGVAVQVPPGSGLMDTWVRNYWRKLQDRQEAADADK